MTLFKLALTFVLDLIILIAVSSFFQQVAQLLGWASPFPLIAWVVGAAFASFYMSKWRPQLRQRPCCNSDDWDTAQSNCPDQNDDE